MFCQDLETLTGPFMCMHSSQISSAGLNMTTAWGGGVLHVWTVTFSERPYRVSSNPHSQCTAPTTT